MVGFIDVVSKRDRGGYEERQRQQLAGGRGGAHSHLHQSPAPLSTAPCNIHPQPVSQPCSGTGRIQPKGASRSPLNLLHTSAALSRRSQTDPCLSNSVVTIKIWSEGAFSPTLPLTQRANVPLKMHILAALLVYLMHMHHTSGTKWNDIASDTEYPSSDIQFRFLREEAGVHPHPHVTVQTEPWECETDTALVERHPSGCWLDSHLHTRTDSLFPSPTKCEISSDALRERAKTWCNTESSLCYQ